MKPPCFVSIPSADDARPIRACLVFETQATGKIAANPSDRARDTRHRAVTSNCYVVARVARASVDGRLPLLCGKGVSGAGCTLRQRCRSLHCSVCVSRARPTRMHPGEVLVRPGRTQRTLGAAICDAMLSSSTQLASVKPSVWRPRSEDPGILGTTVLFPKQSRPGGHGRQMSRFGRKMYWVEASHFLHCWRSWAHCPRDDPDVELTSE
eukprot:2586994-Rhodomonas_salina.7